MDVSNVAVHVGRLYRLPQYNDVVHMRGLTLGMEDSYAEGLDLWCRGRRRAAF